MPQMPLKTKIKRVRLKEIEAHYLFHSRSTHEKESLITPDTQDNFAASILPPFSLNNISEQNSPTLSLSEEKHSTFIQKYNQTTVFRSGATQEKESIPRPDTHNKLAAAIQPSSPYKSSENNSSAISLFKRNNASDVTKKQNQTSIFRVGVFRSGDTKEKEVMPTPHAHNKSAPVALPPSSNKISEQNSSVLLLFNSRNISDATRRQNQTTVKSFMLPPLNVTRTDISKWKTYASKHIQHQNKTKCHQIGTTRDVFDNVEISFNCPLNRTQETMMEKYMRTLCSIEESENNTNLNLDTHTKAYMQLTPVKHKKLHCLALKTRRKNCFPNETMDFNMRGVSGYSSAVDFRLFSNIDDYLGCRSDITKEPATYRLARLFCRAASIFTEVENSLSQYDLAYGD
ncbi:unnamed protein product [Orchesella dallaii]|uniref:Uncharacterized protein n=1 Tax=Orchesella dallaii TaxID=48710 RepID=A0ABP1QYL2_9HEXA